MLKLTCLEKTEFYNFPVGWDVDKDRLILLFASLVAMVISWSLLLVSIAFYVVIILMVCLFVVYLFVCFALP